MQRNERAPLGRKVSIRFRHICRVMFERYTTVLQVLKSKIKAFSYNINSNLKCRKTACLGGFSKKGGPSDRIRTCGILLPKQARYQLRYTRICNDNVKISFADVLHNNIQPFEGTTIAIAI